MTNISTGKYYTRIIGVFFILVVLSLAGDYVQFGFRAETMHKIFHVILGAIVVFWGWNNDLWWRTFPLANGAFFIFVSVFGLFFRDFAGLDAFNTVDTVLHFIVGSSGLIVGAASFRENPFFTNKKIKYR